MCFYIILSNSFNKKSEIIVDFLSYKYEKKLT